MRSQPRSSKDFAPILEVADQPKVAFVASVGIVVGMGIAPADGTPILALAGYPHLAQRSSALVTRRKEAALVLIGAIKKPVQVVEAHPATKTGFSPVTTPIQVVVVAPVAYVAFFITRIVVEAPKLGKVPHSNKGTQHEARVEATLGTHYVDAMP